MVNWYCMCKRDAETVGHLLLHYWWLGSFGVWSSLGLGYNGREWVVSGSVMELLIAWKGARVGKRRKCVWAMISLYVRASIEPNFHDMYLKFIDKVNSKPLNKEIVQATYENCKVLIGSELIKSSSEERSLPKEPRKLAWEDHNW
ncbi:hypothetical protein RHMOL_Rhmol04G0138000 [Rhododendron molle]|uniref:Uncharacterized protein n=1 Tax=Rhododendron molle TaxID=49168 RepID=A0ACC0P2A3_RHOML|nr:hypothetical protein RHMOL_Rhmol04G0138000 [Rhododendron molle]